MTGQLQLLNPGMDAARVPLLTAGAALGRAAGSAPAPSPSPAAVPAPPGPDTGGQPPQQRRGLRSRAGRTAWAGLAVSGLLAALAAVAAAAVYLTFPKVIPPAWAASIHHLRRDDLSWLIPAAALLALAGVVGAWRAVCRLLQGHRTADVLTLAAASIASIVSATGMWKVFTNILHLDTLLTVMLFPFIEVGVLACAAQARENMRREAAAKAGSAAAAAAVRGIDVDRLAMWALTFLTGFLASLAATSGAEAIFRFAPPIVAAWLWERRLVSERRRIILRRGSAGPAEWQGILSRALRLAIERPLVRLGLADPAGRATGDLAAQHLITQLALAAERAAALDAVPASARRRRRADERLRRAQRRAVEHTDLSTNVQRQHELVHQVAMLSGYRQLAELDAAPPWAHISRAQQAFLNPRKERRRDDRRTGPDGHGQRDEQQQDHTGGGPHHDHGGGGGPQDTQLPPLPPPPNPAPDQEATSRYRPLADALLALMRQADAGGIRFLFGGRDDHTEFARWLGTAQPTGAKRMLALTALAATGWGRNVTALKWITGQHIPEPVGKVDKSEVGRMARLAGIPSADRPPTGDGTGHGGTGETETA